MTKEELLQRLADIEWDDFEVKEAQDNSQNHHKRSLSILAIPLTLLSALAVATVVRMKLRCINKMIGWEHLTGEKVTFESDIDSSTVTYFRPKLGGSHGGSTTPITTPQNDTEDRILSIVRSTPNISKAEIGSLLGISANGVRYYIDKLRKSGKLEWQGHSRTGKWVIKY